MLTPEIALWTNVLRTWRTDAFFKRQKNLEYRKNFLLSAKNKRTREICEWLNVSYPRFIEELSKIMELDKNDTF